MQTSDPGLSRPAHPSVLLCPPTHMAVLTALVLLRSSALQGVWRPGCQLFRPASNHQIYPRASGSDPPSSYSGPLSMQGKSYFNGSPTLTGRRPTPFPATLHTTARPCLPLQLCLLYSPLLSQTLQQSTCLPNKPLSFTHPHFVHAVPSASSAFPPL